MNLQVIGIDQRVPFGTKGQVQNYLVIRLPNGKEARAAIDLDTTKELLALDANGSNGAQPPTASAPNENFQPYDEGGPAVSWDGPSEEVSTAGLRPAGEVVGATEAETVEWSKLPDDVLHPAMKAAFMSLEVAARLTPAQIRSMEQEVNEKFGPQEWEEVLGPMADEFRPKTNVVQPPRPAPVPQPQRPVAQVQWADGSPMVAGGTPSRTIPKTDMGYPITDDGTVDAGEVVGGTDSDEDGVGQL